MTASDLVLGGVKLAYCEFRWPLYRGMTPRPVEIDQPAALFPALKAMAQGLGGFPTYLAGDGPAKAGTSPGARSFYYGGVYVANVALLDAMRCRVTLYDRRYELARRVMDKSYRIQFGDGYMNGTDKKTYREAIEDIVGSIDLLSDSLADDAYNSVPEADLPENLLLDGLPLLTALGTLGESGGFDLCVDWHGKYYFANRADVDGSVLPGRNEYSWRMQPGWVIEENIRLQRPRTLSVYSKERHCLKLQGVDPRSTISHNEPPELRVELEQVYSSKGEIYTLDELLVACGFTAGTLTDTEIASVYMTDTFQGTTVEADGTANTRDVITAIKDGWRTLWRIKFSDERGSLGGWEDWEFGQINADGSVSEVAVDCKWVEFINVLDLPENADTTINAKLTHNHDGPAPFTPLWEMGPANRVIRLVQRPLQDGNQAVPGALTAPLTVTLKNSVETEEGESIPLDLYEIVDMEDRNKARFTPSFQLSIYVCATRRAPNDETRWHREDVEAYPDGDIADAEIPPGTQLCVRDYATDSNRQADGLGPVLNADIVKADAERRAEAWKIAFGQMAAGEGVAESVMMATEWKVNGAIAEISLDGTIEGAGVQVFRSRMVVGGLLDAEAIDKRAAILVKERGMKEAGLPIA